jgi:hypothetical protein
MSNGGGGFFLHLRFCAELRVLRAGFTVNHRLLTIFLVCSLPAVEDLAGNAEMAAAAVMLPICLA